MSSSIEAFISRSRPALETIAVELKSQCVDLPQEFALVPVPEHSQPGDWRDAYNAFTYLSPTTAQLAQRCSALGAVAYVEAETFAGPGLQRAVVWDGGAIVWGPRHTCDEEVDAGAEVTWAGDHLDTAVNAALRHLGVLRGDHADEYAALGLDSKRHTSDWRP